jgi:phosphatidate cytidylyltransferase
MSNILQRLLLFFLGVPLVIAVIVLLPQFNHAAAILIIVVFCGGCALELSRLFIARGIKASQALAIALGAGLPACAYAGGLASKGSNLGGSVAGIALGIAAIVLVSCTRFAFVKAKGIPDVLPQVGALFLTLIYPGLLGAVIVLIAAEPRYSTESLLSFCILTFSNDSLAWLVGITIGRHRGFIAVSPNKSVEGFIGGICGSIGMAFVCLALFPYAMDADWLEILTLGLTVGIAGILGDLFESALKRSAGIKDSGSTVPGRGGFLDSFDSLLFAAPVFYGLSLLMGLFR